MNWLTYSVVGRVLTGTLVAAVLANANDTPAVSRIFAFSIVAALLAFLRRPSPVVAQPSPVVARLEVIR